MMPPPPIFVAAIAAARRRISRHFRDAGALSAAAAVPYSAGRPIERRIFARLVDSGIVVEPRPGLFYLDEALFAAQASRRRRRVAFIAITVGAIAVAVILLAR